MTPYRCAEIRRLNVKAVIHPFRAGDPPHQLTFLVGINPPHAIPLFKVFAAACGVLLPVRNFRQGCLVFGLGHGLLNALKLEVGARLPPAAQGLVLTVAAVVTAFEVLLAVPVCPEIRHVGIARYAAHGISPTEGKMILSAPILPFMSYIVIIILLLSSWMGYHVRSIEEDGAKAERKKASLGRSP
jgi:hypothetical protein